MAIGIVGWLTTASCSDNGLQPRRAANRVADLQISASVAGTPVSTLVVTVTAPDIESPLVFNIATLDGVASGSISVPVGTGRSVAVRAIDAAGAPTHEGSALVDVKAGENAAVSIVLTPIVGTQPIDVRIGNFVIVVTPDQSLISKRQKVALSVAVLDLNGVPVPFNPANVRWASFDTRVATVDMQGTVTGQDLGDVQVVASYSGAAGAARFTVAPAVLAAGDIAECTNPGPPPGPGAAEIATAAILDTLDGVVLALGDNAYPDGTLAEYMNCYDPAWGRHKSRTRPVPGNHEYRTTNATGYYDYFGAIAGERFKGYYSFDVGAWHLIALNTELTGSAMTAQVNWLKADLLAKAATKCVLAYWHRPRFNSGERHGTDEASEARSAAFVDALYAAGADVVLVGHEHLYERFAKQNPAGVADPVRGIRHFTSGGGGADLYDFATPLDANHEFGVSTWGILALVLGPDSYSWRFIARSGSVQDSGTTTCH